MPADRDVRASQPTQRQESATVDLWSAVLAEAAGFSGVSPRRRDWNETGMERNMDRSNSENTNIGLDVETIFGHPTLPFKWEKMKAIAFALAWTAMVNTKYSGNDLENSRVKYGEVMYVSIYSREKKELPDYSTQPNRRCPPVGFAPYQTWYI